MLSLWTRYPTTASRRLVTCPAEETNAVSEQNRDHVDGHVIQQVRLDALARHVGSEDDHVLVARCAARRLHRCADVAGKEGDARVFWRVVRQYEHRPGPRAAIWLAELRSFLDRAHLIGVPAGEDCPDPLQELIDLGVFLPVAEHPAHGILGPRDEAVERYRHMP